MIVTALKEYPKDTRVALTPHCVKQYLKLSFEIFCEQGSGIAAGFSDDDYRMAGALVLDDRKAILAKTSVLLAITPPCVDVINALPADALVICPADNDPTSALVQACCKHKISLFSMNLIPRISRAQSLDSLSSQANLAGYRAVLEGVMHFNRAIPMMMTAAGMIHPAKVLVIGAGVAGLQAIATAKRLGAAVFAFDVRPAAKEQVESLGAEFIEVERHQDENSETLSGYAREMSEEYKAAQAALIHHYATEVDIIITTALIPGKKAPILIDKDAVFAMKPGSIIVDIATSQGGNCALSQKDKIVEEGGVVIVGYSNLAGFVPKTASELYSQNCFNLMKLITDNNKIILNPDDEIVKSALLCHDGRVLPFQTIKETEA